MTLEERRTILQERLNEGMTRKSQLEMALAQQVQAVERLIGALQTVEELLNERQSASPGTDVAAGEPVGSNSSDPHVAE